MKKLLCLLLAIIMILSLVACDKKDKEDDEDETEKTTQTEKEEEKEEPEKEEEEEEEEEEEQEDAEVAPYEAKLELYIAANVFAVSEEQWQSLFPAAMYEVVSEMLPYEDYVASMEEAEAETIEEYGEDYEVSYEVLKETELTGDDLDELLSALEAVYGVEVDGIQECYLLDVELTIKGSEGEDTSETTFYAFYLDGEWYVMD